MEKFAFHKLLIIDVLRKLFAIRFKYKHSKFGVDRSIYPECNAWRHRFAYGHKAVKRGARAQFPPKLSLDKVLNFRNFLLSSPKLRQSLKS